MCYSWEGIIDQTQTGKKCLVKQQYFRRGAGDHVASQGQHKTQMEKGKSNFNVFREYGMYDLKYYFPSACYHQVAEEYPSLRCCI